MIVAPFEVYAVIRRGHFEKLDWRKIPNARLFPSERARQLGIPRRLGTYLAGCIAYGYLQFIGYVATPGMERCARPTARPVPRQLYVRYTLSRRHAIQDVRGKLLTRTSQTTLPSLAGTPQNRPLVDDIAGHGVQFASRQCESRQYSQRRYIRSAARAAFARHFSDRGPGALSGDLAGAPGTRNRELAHEFINQFASLEFQREYAAAGFPSPIPEVAEEQARRDPLWARVNPHTSGDFAALRYYPYDAYLKHWDDMTSRWDQEVLV